MRSTPRDVVMSSAEQRRSRVTMSSPRLKLGVVLVSSMVALILLVGREHQSACAKRFSQSSEQESMLACVRQVLESELPLSRRRVSVREGSEVSLSVAFAHHYDAGREDLWNEEIRLVPDEAVGVSRCSIWEVGANVKANDSRRFMNIFKGCQFHAYEPVPMFVTELVESWSTTPGEYHLHIHPYGLGISNRSFTMKEEDILGESTFIQEQTSGNVEIQIKSFAHAARDAGGIPSLISINCEGCEWDLVREGLDADFLQHVNVIQIGWHNYGDHFGLRVLQLCELRRRLSLSHDFVGGIAFGWERWRKKTI